MNKLFVTYNQTESLLNRSLNTIINNFELLELKQLSKLPCNILSILLKVLSKRGRITDEYIQIVFFLNYLFMLFIYTKSV
jgi:hypothetical protein